VSGRTGLNAERRADLAEIRAEAERIAAPLARRLWRAITGR